MSEIKYIYFDVGGVVVLDFSKTNKWEEMKIGLGLDQSQFEKFDKLWKENAQRACLDYHVDKLIPILRNELSINIPYSYSLNEDFVKRFEFNPTIWPLIRNLKKKYKVGLITNMFPGMLDLIYQNKLMEELEWDNVLDSTVIMRQKPNDDIYDLAEEKAKVKPSEILFIDNLEHNLEPVEKRGWKTFLYDPTKAEKMNRTLEELLL